MKRIAGRLDEARRWYTEAIAAYHDLGDRRLELVARSELAHVLRRGGAEALYREMIPAWRHLWQPRRDRQPARVVRVPRPRSRRPIACRHALRRRRAPTGLGGG